MKRLYFGTDGVRGPYGGDLMNEDFAWRLGVAVTVWMHQAGTALGSRVLIGRDTRASGRPLTEALAAGIAHGGYQPISLGVLPTPGVCRAVCTRGAVLGAVITASHNHAADNGIKFFKQGGTKFSDEEEMKIESYLPHHRSGSVSFRLRQLDATYDYFSALGGVLTARLDGWRIVLDTANGATVFTSSQVLRSSGAEVIALGAEPDGLNINDGCGSEHPEKLSAAVKQHGARLGIAHDGDGDRCVLCDEHGEVLDGDEILTILALHALKQGRLVQNLLVVTMQSNLGVEAAVEAAGGRVARTPIGDRYVIERMRAEGATLGGESSGHIICSDVSPTGDGLVAALKVVEVMVATGRPLSELRRALVKFPQLAVALKVRVKKPMETLSALAAAVHQLETELGSRGRVLVRYSGTEPKIRLLVEGPTEAVVRAGMEFLQAATRADLEVL